MTKKSIKGTASQRIIKAKQRVKDHGEVFTPPALVKLMCDLVDDATKVGDERPLSAVACTVLEPSAGTGNFLVEILQRKLATVEREFAEHKDERRKAWRALEALTSIYGVELQEDNHTECIQNMLAVFCEYLQDATPETGVYRAAKHICEQNIICGNTLTMRTTKDNQPFKHLQWNAIGDGQFQRGEQVLELKYVEEVERHVSNEPKIELVSNTYKLEVLP